MKKTLTLAITIISLLPSFTLAAPPSYSVQRTLLPETNSLYYLGTTSPSTRAWKSIITDQVCLTADVCKTAWPVGGGGSGGGTWATTTSTVTNRFINYPLNTTDIPCIGGTATTTCKTWFDPNTNINQINGILNIGNSVPPQSTGFGTNNGKYQLHFSTSTNDVAGADFYNIDPGIEAAAGVFFQNNKSPLGGIGLAQTYYGGVIFSGGGWNGAALGVGALPANSLGVYASDGALVLGSATSTGHIDFITGPSSFSSGAVDATLLNNGNFGIGTTSPYARLSVTNATISTAPAFAISTSTITATSTAFTVDSNGFVGIGTSTPASALSIFNDQGINFTRATSTFNGTQGGINIKSGCFALNGTCLTLASLSGNAPVAQGGTGSTTLGGVLAGNGASGVKSAVIGTGLAWDGTTLSSTGGGGGAGTYPFTPNTNFAAATNATTGVVWFQNGMQASTTSQFDAINVLNATTTNRQIVGVNLGIATSTPGTVLGVTGAGVFTDQVTAKNFFATSTTASSTFLGPLNIGTRTYFVPNKGTRIEPDQSNVAGGNPFVIKGQQGQSGGNNGGELTLQAGDATTASVGGDLILNSGTKGTSGGTQGKILIANTKDGTLVGVSTSTPYRTLSVAGDAVVDNNILSSYFIATSTTVQNVFPLLSATTATTSKLFATSNVGIATSTPGTALSVTGAGVITEGLTTTYVNATSTTATSTFGGGLQAKYLNITGASTATSTASSGFNLTGGCFSINNVCVGNVSVVGGTITGNGIAGMMTAWTSTSNIVGTSTIMAERFVGTSTTAASSSIPSLELTNLQVTGNAEIGVPRYPWLSGMLLSVDSTGLTEATGTPTAGFFNATSTTASSTFQGLEANLLHIRSTTASSTFENGINLTKGCFAINGACITGGNGGSGTITGTGIAGMMTAFSSASNLIPTSTIMAERIIATSTTATSTFLGSMTIGTATSTQPQSTLYIGGSSYTEPQVLATSTLMSLDFCTTKNIAVMGVGPANITFTWVNANLCPGKTVILSNYAPRTGLIGSTTFAGTAATGPVIWDGNINPGNSVINGSMDRFIFTSSATTTSFIEADLTGTF